MVDSVSCPKCGAHLEVTNPGIAMLVCEHCRSAVYREGEAVQLGRESIPITSDARLFVGATGTLGGEAFRVLGRLRYDYGRGGWDEWYAELGDGVTWLSEDQRRIRRERAVQVGSAPAASEVQVGDAVDVGGPGMTVREVGDATCTGAEGQLPFAVRLGEVYRYAVFASADGAHTGTLEYDRSGGATCFLGREVGHGELAIEGEPDAPAAAAEGASIDCTNCGGALEVPGGREVETRVCEYCGAQLDLTTAERAVLGVNPERGREQFQLAIGDAGALDGQRYEVCGRLLWRDGWGDEAREYLLFAPEAGYRWLVEESGHHVLVRPTDIRPGVDLGFLNATQPVTVAGERFRKYESGAERLVYVDGALPWRAKVDDTVRFDDVVAPPRLLSRERDGESQEEEFFLGEYLSAELVWRAFGKEGSPPAPDGVHAAQPGTIGRGAKILAGVGAAAAVVNLLLLIASLVQDGRMVFTEQFTPGEYDGEAVSEPFELPDEAVLGLEVEAPLDNSWVYVQAAVLDDATDEVVAEWDHQIGYYHGRSGGESWTEGEKQDTTYVRSPGPGRYRLIVTGEGGQWPSTYRGNRGEPVRLSVHAGGMVSRYFLIAFFVTGLVPGLVVLRRLLFEGRRWSPVTGDD